MKMMGLQLLSGKTEIMALGKKDWDILQPLEQDAGRVYPKPVSKVVPVTDDADHDLRVLIGREAEKWIVCLPTFIEAPKLRDIDPNDRRRVVVPPGAK